LKKTPREIHKGETKGEEKAAVKKSVSGYSIEIKVTKTEELDEKHNAVARQALAKLWYTFRDTRGGGGIIRAQTRRRVEWGVKTRRDKERRHRRILERRMT